MKIKQKIKMDFAKRTNVPLIDAVQGDSARWLEVELFLNGKSWNIPDGVQVVMRYCNTAGGGGTYDSLEDGTRAWSASSNRIAIALPSAVCAVSGDTQLQVTMMKSGVQISTFSVILRVQRGTDAAQESGDYTNLETWLREQERELPEGGRVGQVLSVGENLGPVWADPAPTPVALLTKTYVVKTDSDIDAALEAELESMSECSMRHIGIQETTGSTIFGGGLIHITIYKTTSDYASVETIRYGVFGVEKCVRQKYGSWKPWEWVSPPMELGVEYRTTERYNGKPVYTKLVNMGKGPASGAESSVVLSNTGEIQILSAEVIAQGFSMGTEGFPMSDYILSLPYKTQAAEIVANVIGWSTNEGSKVTVYSVKGDLSFADCQAKVRYLKY